ncbi:MAG TPA: A/G-specific adenine glycosylase, partial [Flavobacteriia bacterium]|nr:A/G-specific adenine glycosylase [Flavobacteriia bacterium]
MKKFSKTLLKWYTRNRRDFLWRETKEPYNIWLSEIILQQTKTEQGIPYYEKFIKKYPTIKELALADEQEVLKIWQGLGYYSRARNLHHT